MLFRFLLGDTGGVVVCSAGICVAGGGTCVGVAEGMGTGGEGDVGFEGWEGDAEGMVGTIPGVGVGGGEVCVLLCGVTLRGNMGLESVNGK